jgi:hypothetical protein
MARNAIPALLAALVLAGGLAACGEKEETIDGSDTQTTGASGAAAEVAGDWTGRLTQKGIPPFEVAVRINPSGTARVAYTGIDCAGRWELGPVVPASGGNPARYTFRETITAGVGGNCKGTGDVTISAAGVGVLAYEFTGGGVTSRGTLTATDTDGLLPTFRQARGQD